MQPTASQNNLPGKFLRSLVRLEYFIAALGSAAIFLGFANPLFHCPAAILLLPACLFWQAIASSSGRQAFVRGWYTAAWGFSASLYWLSVPMHTVGGLPLILTIPCILLLGSFLGLYAGLASFAFRGVVILFSRHSRTDSRESFPSATLPLSMPASTARRLGILVLCSLCYGGVEILSAHVLTGFPWLSLPMALSSIPLLVQPVNIIGTYGYSALLTSIAISPFLCKSSPTRIPAAGIYAAGIIGCVFLYSQYSLNSFGPNAAEKTRQPSGIVRVGIVQGNIDQNQKWSPEYQAATVRKHLDLSRQAMQTSRQPLDLLLWPETAMPFYYQNAEPYSSQINAFAKTNGINIIFGTLGYAYLESGKLSQFNRMQFVSSLGIPSGAYDKQHLVPFGEYNPIPVYIEFLENILQGVNFSAGPNNRPLTILPAGVEKSSSLPGWPPDRSNTFLDSTALPEIEKTPGSANNTASSTETSGPSSGQHSSGQFSSGPHPEADSPLPNAQVAHIGGLICYEVIFPALAQGQVAKGANILFTISNDSWFGRTSAPAQHLGHAVLRAVEQGRSVVRSTTSGYSALILPTGEVKHKSSLFTEGAFAVEAPLFSHQTIYHRLYHFVDALLLLGLCIAVTSGFFYRKNLTKTNS